MIKRISPAELKAMLSDGGELGLFDVREEGTFSASHLFYAAPMPLSRLEILGPRLAPRRNVRMVLVDDASGLVERAAAILTQQLDYCDVSILDGGIAGWQAAGYELFSGVHVPSKAFGEFVEVNYDTPHIDAQALKAMQDAGEDLVVLDSRPVDEYRNMNIPGGIDCPGAELVYRVSEIAASPDTKVVVNCAGRTRSIIGAQSLINAAIPNQVVALKNGTMGWHLAGFELERGQDRMAPDASPEGLVKAEAYAAAVAERFRVERIDAEGLAQWQAEAGERSLYLLDVRTRGEYERGHLAGSQLAPGGQLVQETESWIGVLGSRAVLIDDNEVRAIMTASWLVQMGWQEVRVLAGGLDGHALESGLPDPHAQVRTLAGLPEISTKELSTRLDAGDGVVVLDFADSHSYAAGHIPGAWFAIRARLPESLPRLPDGELLVFTSEDGVIARLAAPEAQELTDVEIRVLAGGTRAWVDGKLDLESGHSHMLDERQDVWLKPYDSPGSVEDRMRAYLTWEVDLADKIERDGDHRFKLFPS